LWKRCGSGKPQQRAAARSDTSLAERPERQAAVPHQVLAPSKRRVAGSSPAGGIIGRLLPKRHGRHRIREDNRDNSRPADAHHPDLGDRIVHNGGLVLAPCRPTTARRAASGRDTLGGATAPTGLRAVPNDTLDGSIVLAGPATTATCRPTGAWTARTAVRQRRSGQSRLLRRRRRLRRRRGELPRKNAGRDSQSWPRPRPVARNAPGGRASCVPRGNTAGSEAS
jgi:hypothetical protein